ncbi:hypothetical protein ACOMHN_053444 [Nucella lapillus]
MASPSSPSSADPEATDSCLSPEHEGTTILALRMSSRRRLGMFLNMESMPLHSGLLPNYQGLAELIGFEFVEQLSFQRERDPTQALLMEWGNHPDLNPTLGNLVRFLQQLERLDILEECKDIIRNDAEHFVKKKSAASCDINPVQDSTVSQSPLDINDMTTDETAIMTVQDVEAGKPTYYDAFVCYHPEGEDLDFVKKLIEKVENPPYNLRLFVPHRDDLPGSSKYVISAKLIQDRCKRMVIVMSPRYLQSEACDFQTKFAHALSPGSRSKKLVPVLIQYCSTPNILRHVTMCDYTRGDMTGWFWDRLTKTLQAPLNPQDITIDNPNHLASLEMNLGDQSASLSSSLAASASTREEGGGGGTSGSAESQPQGLSLPVSPGQGTPQRSPQRTPQRTPQRSPQRTPESSPEKGSASKKKGAPPRGSPAPSHDPHSSSSSPDSKGGTPKKKGLKSKLSAVFSSHS